MWWKLSPGQKLPFKARLTGKLGPATTEGRAVAEKFEVSKTHRCSHCSKLENVDIKFKVCSNCQASRYCSKKCQNEHYEQHKVLCTAISQVHRQKQQSDSNVNKGSYVSHLTPKQHRSVANLVESKCMVSGLIGGAQVKLLWDTGSEVSIVSQDWVEANLPDHEIKNISEILEEGRELTLKAANGTDIPYIGYIEASFELKDSACPITVSFLVTEEKFDPFILGYNVIELIVAERSNAEHEEKVPISEVLSESFSNMSSGNIRALINFVQTSKNGILCDLKTTKNDVIIPPKQSVKVVCRANTDGLSKKIPALFQPSEEPSWPSGIEIPETLVVVTPGKSLRVTVCAENTTDRPTTLKNRSCIGRLELVKSVTSLEVRQTDLLDGPEKQSSVEASTNAMKHFTLLIILILQS